MIRGERAVHCSPALPPPPPPRRHSAEMKRIAEVETCGTSSVLLSLTHSNPRVSQCHIAPENAQDLSSPQQQRGRQFQLLVGWAVEQRREVGLERLIFLPQGRHLTASGRAALQYHKLLGRLPLQQCP